MGVTGQTQLVDIYECIRYSITIAHVDWYNRVNGKDSLTLVYPLALTPLGSLESVLPPKRQSSRSVVFRLALVFMWVGGCVTAMIPLFNNVRGVATKGGPSGVEQGLLGGGARGR